MLGNLAEALLALASLLTVPALIAVIVVLVRQLSKSRREAPNGVTGQPVPQVPATVYVALSIVAGAAAAFISLEAYLFGIALAAAAGLLLFGQARNRRWYALGGFLLGMGLCGTASLRPALTNHDPAVSYDPSTIPTFWVSAALALGGAVLLVAATTARVRAITPRRGRR